MAVIDSQPDKREIRDEVQMKPGYVYVQTWTNPIAAAATTIHAGITTAAVVTTGITQPDFPRVLSITGGGSSHSATGNVVVNGTNIRGEAISDTITLNSNTTVNGVKAFASVTSIDTTGVGSIDANDTVEVGVSKLLGLERLLPADLVLATSVAGTYEATRPTVTHSASAIESNTLSPNTAPNGSKTIIAAYVTQELTTARRITQ